MIRADLVQSNQLSARNQRVRLIDDFGSGSQSQHGRPGLHGNERLGTYQAVGKCGETAIPFSARGVNVSTRDDREAPLSGGVRDPVVVELEHVVGRCHQP